MPGSLQDRDAEEVNQQLFTLGESPQQFSSGPGGVQAVTTCGSRQSASS
jgi:hypothetical protein